MVTINLVLALAAHFGWTIFQKDVKSAFLNGHLEEEVYMYQPQGFQEVLGKEHMVCKLVKVLYALKQAPRTQYIKIEKHLQDNGFKRSFYDSNIYIKRKDGDVELLVR